MKFTPDDIYTGQNVPKQNIAHFNQHNFSFLHRNFMLLDLLKPINQRGYIFNQILATLSINARSALSRTHSFIRERKDCILVSDYTKINRCGGVKHTPRSQFQWLRI